MSSHPTFNPNQLDEIGTELNENPNKPLINRATQGVYPIGSLVEPFAIAMQDRQTLDEDDLKNIYEELGFYRAPQLRIQVAEPLLNLDVKDLHVSPLQVALAAAALSNHGTIPAPRIATAVNTPEEGWIVLPALGTSFTAIQAAAADETAESLMVDGESYWAHTGRAEGTDSTVTWFMAGTPPNWQATPMVVVVLLEEDIASLAQWIGRELLVDAMNP